MIPRIIHFVWIGGNMPKYAQRNIERFAQLNPEYRIKVHGEDALLPELKRQYDKVTALCSKADLLRYSVLLREGGWYFDCDFYPLRPLDEAINAWGLDGEKTFCSKQQGHRSGNRMPYNNAPLACEPGAEGIKRIIEAIQLIEKPDGRLAYGPAMIKDVIEKHKDIFEVAEPGWFFPVSIKGAAEAYHVLMHAPKEIDIRHSGTAGQIPFAVHLWADVTDLEAEVNRQWDPRPIAAVMDYKNPKQFNHSVARGLEKIGYQVARFNDPEELRYMVRKPRIVAAWNGVRDPRWWDIAAEIGATRLSSEHGFFDRNNFFQLDHKGFLHRSSIADALRRQEDAGPTASIKLSMHASDRVPVQARDDGYMLILGQVNGDTQLVDSECKGHAPMLRMLARSIPRGLRAIYRPHPQMAKRQAGECRRWPAIEQQKIDYSAEYAAYGPNKHGTTLDDALAGARFCVAINSNALVEATVRGIPCAAFGPALGIDAGVYYKIKFNTRGVEQMYERMLSGWHPPTELVERFLLTLADRQYSREEIEEGTALTTILTRAGAHMPDMATERMVQ